MFWINGLTYLNLHAEAYFGQLSEHKKQAQVKSSFLFGRKRKDGLLKVVDVGEFSRPGPNNTQNPRDLHGDLAKQMCRYKKT